MDDMLKFHHDCLLKEGVFIYILQTDEANWSAEGKQSRGIMSSAYTSKLCSFVQLSLTGKRSLLAL